MTEGVQLSHIASPRNSGRCQAEASHPEGAPYNAIYLPRACYLRNLYEAGETAYAAAWSHCAQWLWWT